MRTLQFNINKDGFLILSENETGKLFYPTDVAGNFLNVPPESFQSIQFVGDGIEIFPISFISEVGLGWITNAINAAATIGSSIIGSNATKKANQSAEKQLQTQQQIELLKLQASERQNALMTKPQNGLSTGSIIAIGVAGVAVVGTILYLVTTSKTEVHGKLQGTKPSTRSNNNRSTQSIK